MKIEWVPDDCPPRLCSAALHLHPTANTRASQPAIHRQPSIASQPASQLQLGHTTWTNGCSSVTSIGWVGSAPAGVAAAAANNTSLETVPQSLSCSRVARSYRHRACLPSAAHAEHRASPGQNIFHWPVLTPLWSLAAGAGAPWPGSPTACSIDLPQQARPHRRASSRAGDSQPQDALVATDPVVHGADGGGHCGGRAGGRRQAV